MKQLLFGTLVHCIIVNAAIQKISTCLDSLECPFNHFPFNQVPGVK